MCSVDYEGTLTLTYHAGAPYDISGSCNPTASGDDILSGVAKYLMPVQLGSLATALITVPFVSFADAKKPIQDGLKQAAQLLLIFTASLNVIGQSVIYFMKSGGCDETKKSNACYVAITAIAMNACSIAFSISQVSIGAVTAVNIPGGPLISLAIVTVAYVLTAYGEWELLDDEHKKTWWNFSSAPAKTGNNIKRRLLVGR